MTAHRKDRADLIRDYIVTFTASNGFAPTIREIGDAVGLASPGATYHHMVKLREAGLIETQHGKARASIAPRHSLTVERLELAWCLSVHGLRPPKVRPCKQHRLMAEWLVELVLPRAQALP